MRFLARVSAHVDDQHVLSFEGFLFAGAFLPAADETLFIGVNVVVVDVLDQVVLRGEFLVAVAPVAMRFDEIARLVLHRVAGTVVTVVIHRLASAVQVVMVVVMVTVLAGHGRLDDSGGGGSGGHRLLLDFGPHLDDFHVSFRVDRAGHGIVRLFFGRLVLGLDAGVVPAVEMAVRAEAHRWRMVTQTRARQLEEIVRILVGLVAGLVQHSRVKRRAVPTQTAAQTASQAARPYQMRLQLLEVSCRQRWQAHGRTQCTWNHGKIRKRRT